MGWVHDGPPPNSTTCPTKQRLDSNEDAHKEFEQIAVMVGSDAALSC